MSRLTLKLVLKLRLGLSWLEVVMGDSQTQRRGFRVSRLGDTQMWKVGDRVTPRWMFAGSETGITSSAPRRRDSNEEFVRRSHQLPPYSVNSKGAASRQPSRLPSGLPSPNTGSTNLLPTGSCIWKVAIMNGKLILCATPSLMYVVLS